MFKDGLKNWQLIYSGNRGTATQVNPYPFWGDIDGVLVKALIFIRDDNMQPSEASESFDYHELTLAAPDTREDKCTFKQVSDDDRSDLELVLFCKQFVTKGACL